MVNLKKRKINLFKTIRNLVVLSALVIASLFFVNYLNKEETDLINVIGTIDAYSYELREEDSEYQKEIFFKLKEVMSLEDVNDEEYAKYLGKLFLVDFYTMDTKLNNQDIGGVKFIYSKFQESFVMYSRDEIYAHVESRLNRNRNQILPIVDNVSMTNIEMDDDSTYIIDYELSYQNSNRLEVKPPGKARINMAFEDEKLVIVDFKTFSNSE